MATSDPLFAAMHSPLDPADPLGLLMHADDLVGPVPDGEPDWAALSAALWAAEHPKAAGTGGFPDFALDYNMDVFDSVAPTALHAYPDPFALPDAGRRMSVTSSSSGSGASLSPVLDPAAVPPPAPMNADSFAALIRTLSSNPALLSGDLSSLAVPADLSTLPKLPIPRVHDGSITGVPTTPIYAQDPAFLSSSSPETGTSAYASASASSRATSSSPPPPAAATAPARAPRPKTDHTTIERRYRTNLNARITALKRAVPALRVLEPALALPGDTAAVDDRGFIDGVRVARKVSKGNVLGKAGEYIRVLKKREARLIREAAGLKALLVSTLPGATQLLAAWEHEWRAQHGGAERDEVDGDSEDADDDGDDVGGEDDDEAERPKKRARPATDKKKAAAAAAPAATDPNAPERRKRGRPRKNPLPAAPTLAAAPTSPTAPVAPANAQPVQAAGPPQYLLGAFAFFSFMHPLSPATSSNARPHTRAHQGHVFGTMSVPPSQPSHEGYGWGDLVQLLHLVVSAAVFASIVLPWLPTMLARVRAAVSRFSSGPARGRLLAKHAAPRAASSSPSGSSIGGSIGSSDDDTPATSPEREGRWAELSAALAPSQRGTPNEAAALRRALGVRAGFVGLALQGFAAPRPRVGLQRRQLEQRAWVRLGELVALGPARALGARAQTFLSMRAHTDPYKPSARDLATLALLVRPLAPAKADALWAEAARAGPDRVRAHERLALQLGVDGAAARVKAVPRTQAPLAALGDALVREGIAAHATRLFICAVDGAGGDDGADAAECAALVRAGEAASTGVRALALRFARALAGRADDAPAEAGEEDGAAAVLRALALFRAVFVHGAGPVAALALRTALGARALDALALEDVRDRAVDMLVERERAARGV